MSEEFVARKNREQKTHLFLESRTFYGRNAFLSCCGSVTVPRSVKRLGGEPECVNCLKVYRVRRDE